MDEQETISKKDVLEQTKISYGQFYRWKRKGLIPEVWFERRSTYTGQETFLPREKILERIERIKSLKDDYSLDEIAEMLSPDLARKSYTASEVAMMDWISEAVRDLYESVRSQEGVYRFDEILYLTVVEQLIHVGKLSRDQIELATRTLIEGFDEFGDAGQDRFLAVASRFGVSFSVLYSSTCLFDPDTEVVAIVNLNRPLEEIKVKLQEKF
ncbi:MAG: DUF4004 family protein [Candidatus Bipolaricaulia bacterium]